MSFWNFLGGFALFNAVCDLFSGKSKSNIASSQQYNNNYARQDYLDDRYDELQDRIDRLQDRLDSYDDDIDDMEDELYDLQDELDDLELERDMLDDDW